MTPSMQVLKEGFISVVSEKDEMEYQDKSKQIARLPLSVNQDSRSDADISISELEKNNVHVKLKTIKKHLD